MSDLQFRETLGDSQREREIEEFHKRCEKFQQSHDELEKDRDQLRAKVAVLRDALQQVSVWISNPNLFPEELRRTVEQALATAPVKGWVRVGELEKALKYPLTADELTRLQSLIEKEK